MMAGLEPMPHLLVIGGAGDLGRKRILPALAELGIGADVVDPQPLKGPLPPAVRRTYPSLTTVDPAAGYLGAVIASPNHLHLPHARWATATAGLPCLCEKPIAHSLDAAGQMVELAAGTAPVWVADHYLVKPATAFVLAHREGLLQAIGHVRRVRGRILEPVETLTGRSWLLDPDRSGGGVWIDTGVHLVTVLLSLWPQLSWQVTSAAASGYDQDLNHAETSFSLCAVAATPGGMEIKLQAGKTTDTVAKDLLIEGAQGSLLLDWQTNAVWMDGVVLHESAQAPPFGGYLALLDAFVCACLGCRGMAGADLATAGAPAPAGMGMVPCDLALQALRLIKSGYAAAESLPTGLREACLR